MYGKNAWVGEPTRKGCWSPNCTL